MQSWRLRRISRDILPVRGVSTKNDSSRGVSLTLLVGIALFAVMLVGFWVIETHLRPVVAILAEVQAVGKFTEVIDDAILNDLSQRGTGYEDFVTIERDNDGNIRALTTNMGAMNLLRAELENKVFSTLGEVEASSISIPVGSLFSSELLWGRGPTIQARSITLGVLNSEFVSEFTAAGINQTRHRIYLDIRVPLTLMMAGGTVQTELSTHLCVAETIIVGSVPDSYLQF